MSPVISTRCADKNIIHPNSPTKYSLTSLSILSGSLHSTLPFLFVRGGNISLLITKVSTITVSSRRMSTSHSTQVGSRVMGRGSEIEWRSSMLIGWYEGCWWLELALGCDIVEKWHTRTAVDRFDDGWMCGWREIYQLESAFYIKVSNKLDSFVQNPPKYYQWGSKLHGLTGRWQDRSYPGYRIEKYTDSCVSLDSSIH